MDIGEKIKKIRLDLKLTQENFSQKLKINTRTLQNYEANKTEAPFSLILKICSAFSIAINYFLEDSELILKNKDEYPLSIDEILDLVKKISKLTRFDKELFLKYINAKFKKHKKELILSEIEKLIEEG